MVLRKERSTPSEGINNLSSLSASSSSTSSSRVMSNNEQPVTKRQRIDNKNVASESSASTTTVIASLSSSSASSSASSSSLSLKDDQETPPDILVRPSTSSSSSTSSVTPSSSSSSSLTVGVNLSENHNSSGSSSSVGVNLSSQDEVDRVILPENQDIPDLLRLNSIIANGNNSVNCNSNSSNSSNEIKEFEEYLMKQCLCNINERVLRKSFQNYYQLDMTKRTTQTLHLYEVPTNKLIQFLSNLQLLFDIYLKQNNKGFICNRIMEICNQLIQNDSSSLHHHSHYHHHHHHHYYNHHHGHNFQYNLIDEIIELNNYHNKYVQFLSIKVLSSFLVISKNHINNDNDNWLKKLVDNLFVFEHLDYNAVKKINFSLEIIKRIVEWKDVDIHPLEDEDDDDDDSDLESAGGVGSLRNVGTGILPQQPLLENNYFAVHYNSEVTAASSNNGNNSGVIDRQNLLTSSNSSVNRNGGRLKRRQMIEQNESTSRNNSANDMVEGNGNSSNGVNSFDNSGGCRLITLTDSESFDTTQLKCLTIKILENKWPALVKNMSNLIQSYHRIENSENCILTFLLLWENIISVKANLSIIETLPFYSQLDKFELLLNSSLSCIIYKQMLNLFNEALCYGSTLALQDLLPEETCQLAHQIVRHVKDYRILDSLPRRKTENLIGFIGYRGKNISYESDTFEYIENSGNDTDDDDHDDDGNNRHHSSGSSSDMDKTILQKMVLLILKSIAVTVKEIRSDSSDSSIDSTDYDAFQDMILIERSIRDVLKKLELFIKQQLEFHPECHFSKILIHLFDDQDDYLIEAMVCTLDVTSGISFRNNAFPELVAILNPVYTFLEFLRMISNSTDLLLDLLVSNETCFLLYLLRFLKYIRLNWSMFVGSCHEFNGSGSGSSYRVPYLITSNQQTLSSSVPSSSSSSSSVVLAAASAAGTTQSAANTTLDDAMSVLIRLRLQISRLVSKSLYPYDISPVLRLLESCESLYEGNELS